MSADPFPMPDLDWEPARGFWEGVAAGELRLSYCVACGDLNWYPGACRACGATEVAWRAVGASGRLFTWTIVRRPFLPEYAAHVPLAVGLVVPDLEPRARVAMPIAGAPEVLRCDAPVHIGVTRIAYGERGSFAAPIASIADLT